MKFNKNGTKAGNGATYTSECGRFRITLQVHGHSMVQRDGRVKLGRSSYTTRFYKLEVNKRSVGLASDGWISPQMANGDHLPETIAIAKAAATRVAAMKWDVLETASGRSILVPSPTGKAIAAGL